jgi:16S rRNA (uracil1498-N3)-methyltransferase
MSIASIRLYTPVATLAEGTELPLPEPQAHYLATVLRAELGETCRIFNGQNGEWRAEITQISKKRVTLTARAQTRPQHPAPDAWACFALLKRAKTDLVVEKATELGAAVIQPIITARTQADHVNLERLRAIAIEAAEQCERQDVPEIRPPVPVMQLLQTWPNRPLFVADERRDSPLLGAVSGPCALMVGPEGGFTDAELEAIAAKPQVMRVSLGSRILRAETATIAGLALLIAAQP